MTQKMRKVMIGWTVLSNGKAVGQAEGSYSSRLSAWVTPVYNSVTKARRKATTLGLGYDAVIEVFVELPE